MHKPLRFISCLLLGLLLFASCDEPVEHTAPAIYPRDSVALMTSYGVNALISDSGVVKYRIVTERWELNPNRNPSRSVFEKGIFLTQFDEKFHVQSYIQCDTAYNYDKLKLWELRGRVRILTKTGVRFSSEPLFTPTLIGISRSFAERTTASSLSLPPIFPGFILILSAPFSIAAMAIL